MWKCFVKGAKLSDWRLFCETVLRAWKVRSLSARDFTWNERTLIFEPRVEIFFKSDFTWNQFLIKLSDWRIFRETVWRAWKVEAFCHRFYVKWKDLDFRTQCGNFLQTRFYVKSIFDKLSDWRIFRETVWRAWKSAVLTTLLSLYCDFGHFQFIKRWFHVKSEWSFSKAKMKNYRYILLN